MNDYDDKDDYEQRHRCNVNSLLKRLPAKVRGIGEEVLHAISCGKMLMGWNDKLQLVIDGRAIPNTNSVDLVQYILYPEGNDEIEPPHGFDMFVEELKRIGLEAQWVRNETVINALNDNENEWDTTNDDDDDDNDDEEEEEDKNDKEERQRGPIKWKNFSSDDDDNEVESISGGSTNEEE